MRIAVVSSARWSSFQGSMHHLAIAFTRLGHDVLWVDPPVSPLSIIRQPERFRDLVGPSDDRTETGMRIWRPRVLPGQNASLVQTVNAAWLARGIAKRIGAPDVSVCFTLEARGVMRRLPGRRLYSCVDSLEDLPGVDPAAMRAREIQLLSAVDVVAACSIPLRDQLRARTDHPVTFVPHGCDDIAISAGGSPLPEQLDGHPRPFVGYVGSMNFRLDAEFVDAARRGANGGTMVLIGGLLTQAGPGHNAAVDKLIGRSDVLAVGHKEPPEMARFIAALDVGVVPYALTPFNRKSYPLKIPQYLGAGLPVVSTPNGATDNLAEVLVATTPADFEAKVREAREQGRNPSPPPPRKWTTVAQELLDLTAAKRA